VKLIRRDAGVGADRGADQELHHLSGRRRVRRGEVPARLATPEVRVRAFVDEVHRRAFAQAREVDDHVDPLAVGDRLPLQPYRPGQKAAVTADLPYG
jgi:hypothetical protein